MEGARTNPLESLEFSDWFSMKYPMESINTQRVVLGSLTNMIMLESRHFKRLVHEFVLVHQPGPRSHF